MGQVVVRDGIVVGVNTESALESNASSTLVSVSAWIRDIHEEMMERARTLTLKDLATIRYVAAVIALMMPSVLFVVGAYWGMQYRMDSMEAKFEEIEKRVDGRLSAISGEMDTQFGKLESTVDRLNNLITDMRIESARKDNSARGGGGR